MPVLLRLTLDLNSKFASFASDGTESDVLSVHSGSAKTLEGSLLKYFKIDIFEAAFLTCNNRGNLQD